MTMSRASGKSIRKRVDEDLGMGMKEDQGNWNEVVEDQGNVQSFPIIKGTNLLFS
jgi:hypothetical protein